MSELEELLQETYMSAYEAFCPHFLCDHLIDIVFSVRCSGDGTVWNVPIDFICEDQDECGSDQDCPVFISCVESLGKISDGIEDLS